MKSVDVKPSTYIDFNKGNNKEGSKLKVGDNVTTSKYKNIFAKIYIPNWSEEVFVIKKVKNTVPWAYSIKDLSREKIVGIFHEKQLQKTNQKEFRFEKIIKTKNDKVYVKGKGYDSSLIVGLTKKTWYKWVYFF